MVHPARSLAQTPTEILPHGLLLRGEGRVPPGVNDLSIPQEDPFYYLPRAAGTIRRGLPGGSRRLLEDSGSELASASLRHPPGFPIPPSTAWRTQPRAPSPGTGIQAPVLPPGPATYQLLLLLPMKLCFLSLERKLGRKTIPKMLFRRESRLLSSSWIPGAPILPLQTQSPPPGLRTKDSPVCQAGDKRK